MHSFPASDFSAIALGDGREVELTPVHPHDASAERDFVGALSLASRYRRFHFGLRELSDEQARAMTEIDQHHHVAFAALPSGSPTIVADARYVLRADSADAEFAIAVADAWQGAGLGRELLLRLAEHARVHGVQHLFGDVLWGNNAMLGLARDLGATLRRMPGDATVVRVEFSFVPNVVPKMMERSDRVDALPCAPSVNSLTIVLELAGNEPISPPCVPFALSTS